MENDLVLLPSLVDWVLTRSDHGITRNKNWRSLGELRLVFFEPPRSIEITVLAQFITFRSDLLSESNKLCKDIEPRCGEEARKNG